MKIVLAFDSFKGNLSAQEVCERVKEGILSVRPDIETVICPMADGGEGTGEAMMSALGGEWIPMEVTGPLSHMRVDAGYVLLADKKTAVVEMATASGLPLLSRDELDPINATTYGTGELIKAAIDKGATKILLTIGGSATVDGGVGAAEALGWNFTTSGDIIPPDNFNLPEIDVLCDVTNPLCGPNGAAHVFGPQKGATPDQVEILDAKLFDLSEKAFNILGKDCRNVPGAGAAGGLGFGAMAFMNAKLVSGVDAVIETIGLDKALVGADWVLSGEGKFDSQSVQGKVIDGVQRYAANLGAKTGVIAGCVFLEEPEWRAAGVEWVATLQPEGMSTAESIARSRELMFEAAAEFARRL